MTQTESEIFLIVMAIWLGPSAVLWCFGQVRHFANVFLWPFYLLIILLAAIAAIIQERSFDGLRKFWNHLNGRGFQ